MRGRKSSAEFKADAIALMKRSDRTFPELGADLGVSHWTLRGWYKEEMAKKRSKRSGPQPSPVAPPLEGETAEQRAERLEQEVRRLRKQVEQLEQDRAILKKAAAFFAKESE